MRILQGQVIGLALFVAGVLFATASSAQTGGWWYGDITRVIVETRKDASGATLYGQCAAKLSPRPNTVVPSCSNDFVSFSCSGDHNTKAEGQAKFDQANLAYVTGRKASIYIDGTRTHNQDFCFGQGIWVDNE